MELLEYWLVIEADRQALLAATATALRQLGESPLRHASAMVEASERLRAACAAPSGPARARLTIQGHWLVIRTDDDHGEPPLRVALDRSGPLDHDRLATLQAHLAERFQAQDPEALQKRNEQMLAQFNARRQAMEAELQELQQALEDRQQQLAETIMQAETDALTGAYNRRAFDQKAPLAFNRTLRQGTETLCLLLVDLDEFKELNDTYGHPYGDAYLQHVTETMGRAIRKDVDTLFRIGGDEFAILLFADIQTACARGMQILHELEGRVSIGIAATHHETEDAAPASFEAFQQAADDALYTAKNAGRGQIALAGCTPPGGVGCTRLCTEAQAEEAVR